MKPRSRRAIVALAVIGLICYLGGGGGGGDSAFATGETSLKSYRGGASTTYRHNNTNLPSIPQCTQPQKDAIFNQIGTTLHSKSKCPVPTWIEKFYEEESNIGSESFLGISVGCNKGHDAIRTARMGMRSDLFDGTRWREALGPMRAGACFQEGGDQAEIKRPDEERTREMHCIEPLPTTFALLKRTKEALGLDQLFDIDFVLTHAAISSRDGTVQFPGDYGAGKENLGLTACSSGHGGSNCVDVPMYSLESYVDRFVSSDGPINILQIDVEGFDFDVLFGAGSALDRTQYLEFEYNAVGNWGGLHLQDAVKLLDGKGFTCYWQGIRELWRITGCYIDQWDRWHGWSNVACVHRSQTNLASRMEKQFLSTIG